MVAVTQLPSFVDLTNFSFLADHCLDPSLNTKASLETSFLQMKGLAKEMYESPPKIIRSANGGFSYPANPEVLAYLVEQVRGKVFLEIAGGFGYHGLFLALAGAQKVYMNDSAPEAIAVFDREKACLRPEILARIETIAGDAFELLTKNPNLKADVILCRNFIHFLTDAEQARLIDMMKKILNPGGTVIFTANGAYDSDSREIHKTDPSKTCFVLEQARFLSKETDICLASTTSLCPGEFTPRQTQKTQVYRREEGGSWGQLPTPDLSPQIFDKIKKWVGENKPILKQHKSGRIQNSKNEVRLYTKQTLADLLTQHGFSVSTTFVTDAKGHNVPEGEDPYLRGKQTGAIATFHAAAASAAVVEEPAEGAAAAAAP